MFYDKEKKGYVELFELPMVLQSKYCFNSLFTFKLLIFFLIACGYHLSDAKIEELNKFLEEKQATKVDLNLMI